MTIMFGAGPSFALNMNSSKTLPLAIVNKSGQVLSWQAAWNAQSGGQNWLTVDRTSGTLQISEVQTIYVTAISAQAVGAPGDFTAKLTFTPTVGGIVQPNEVVTIELHVSPGVYSDNGPKAPTLSQSRYDYNVPLGIMSQPNLQVTKNTSETNSVNWTMTSNVNWAIVSPTGGSLDGAAPSIQITTNSGGLAAGSTYTTDLVLTSTFSDPTLAASREPTSVLVPVSIVV